MGDGGEEAVEESFLVGLFVEVVLSQVFDIFMVYLSHSLPTLGLWKSISYFLFRFNRSSGR